MILTDIERGSPGPACCERVTTTHAPCNNMARTSYNKADMLHGYLDPLAGKASFMLSSQHHGKLEHIDSRICDLVEDDMPESWMVPSLISESVLRRSGHIDYFPHQTTRLLTPDSTTAAAYLLPAACLHFYPKLSQIEYRQRVLTTRATVYRFEGGQWDGNVRLWEHTVREFVAVGNHEYVTHWLRRISDRALRLAREYAPARIAVGTDSFIPSRANMARKEYQRRLKTKHELLVNALGTTTPVASFNYHGTHFSKAFGFDQSGEIVTGCIGFGLERWIMFT